MSDNITVAQQESILVNGRIEENLQVGSKDSILPNQDEIRQACDLAMLALAINDMPLGIIMMINSRGGR